MRAAAAAAGGAADGRLARLRRCIKSFVESRHVQRAILVAIMLNSVSMGIEYHNQVITTDTPIISLLVVHVEHSCACVRTVIGSRPSDHYFRSVCLSVCLFVCLFVQSFSQPSLIRFRSNLDICYMSGSGCVP